MGIEASLLPRNRATWPRKIASLHPPSLDILRLSEAQDVNSAISWLLPTPRSPSRSPMRQRDVFVPESADKFRRGKDVVFCFS